MTINSFLLSANYYTDHSLTAQEQEQIFRQVWLYVGPSQLIETPGSVWATEVVGTGLIITHDLEGQLHGFYNMCPHRAMELLPVSSVSHLKKLICPYHGWMYDLQGQLVATARQKDFGAEFRCQNYPLIPIRVEIWQKLLFISFNPDVMPLTKYLNPIPQMLGDYACSQWRWLHRQTRTVKCNWKVFHDNTLCDYHVAVAHARTLHRLQGPVRYYRHHFGEYVNVLVTPLTQEWLTCHQVRADLPRENQTHFYTFGIFPNWHLLALPDGCFISLRIDPVTVNRCQVVTDIYGPPSMHLDKLLTEQEAIVQEDIDLVESVQRNYESSRYSPGPVHPLEMRILHQQKLFLRHLLSGGKSQKPDSP